MNVLVFGASNSSQSINKKLATYAGAVLADMAPEVTIDVIDLNDYEMPIYSPDRQKEGGIPQLAQDFYAKIGAADAVIVSFAEYNGFYTSAYKNIFDWVSRIDMRVYQDKPTVMLSTSPGGTGAANVLKTAIESAGFFGNDVKASLSLAKFGENYDWETDTITDTDFDAQLREAVGSLLD